MKINVPDYINVLGSRFTIDKVNTPTDTQLGEMNPLKRTISVQMDQSSEQIGLTILHEYLHALLSITGYSKVFDDLENPERADSSRVEELFVLLLEEGIRQFMLQFGSEYLKAIQIDGSDDEYK